MKLTVSRINVRKVETTLTESCFLELCAEAVADDAGLNLSATGVTWRAYVTSRDTSTGPTREVKVEITQDVECLPVAAS